MHALGHSGIGSKSRRHIRWFSRRRMATDEGGTEMMTKSRPLARAFALALMLALPLLVVHAQPASPFRIGFLCAYDASPVDEALRQLGYVEGRNAVFEVRATQGRPDRAREQAADLVRAKVDVIVAYTNFHAFAAKQATSTIPIVVGFAHGAVATGLVPSLARPGGNVTGIESLAPELDMKRIELLRQIVPALSSIAALYNVDDSGSSVHLKHTQEAGRTLGVRVVPLEVRTAADYDTVFKPIAGDPVGALLMINDHLTVANWKRVADFALASRTPTVCAFGFQAHDGCLVSYGPTFDEISKRVAYQVDRILKGAKPADIPFEQATRFELVVNLKTAKALGISIPSSVLLRADAVIE
jgi:putative ABC transport system substrate-binding protein